MPKPLAEQVVVITGASQGIGRETALQLAERGASVVLAARNEEALSELSRQVERLGGQAEPVVTDVANPEAVDRLAERHRLPEVISGVPRDPEHPHPGVYPDSCEPQGWSASAVLMVVQALLGMVAVAPLGLLVVDPHLPPWLPELRLEGISVGNARLDVEFQRTKRGRAPAIASPGVMREFVSYDSPRRSRVARGHSDVRVRPWAPFSGRRPPPWSG
ncbi:MAG: SDR family NAD(P)-dependent oxidoreductase, partial [Chloroflexi bacterium]|nr:SDR family NAD(P)-dependent oxidoreductase [Chloroflexota bacterium]